MQLKDTSKMYPSWRIYQRGEKLPSVSFHNGRCVDLSTEETMSMLAKMSENDMLMFYEHQQNGRYQRCSGKTRYLFGCNFSVSKNEDGSICVFGNGCLFE